MNGKVTHLLLFVFAIVGTCNVTPTEARIYRRILGSVSCNTCKLKRVVGNGRPYWCWDTVPPTRCYAYNRRLAALDLDRDLMAMEDEVFAKAHYGSRHLRGEQVAIREDEDAIFDSVAQASHWSGRNLKKKRARLQNFKQIQIDRNGKPWGPLSVFNIDCDKNDEWYSKLLPTWDPRRQPVKRSCIGSIRQGWSERRGRICKDYNCYLGQISGTRGLARCPIHTNFGPTHKKCRLLSRAPEMFNCMCVTMAQERAGIVTPSSGNRGEYTYRNSIKDW